MLGRAAVPQRAIEGVAYHFASAANSVAVADAATRMSIERWPSAARSIDRRRVTGAACRALRACAGPSAVPALLALALAIAFGLHAVRGERAAAAAALAHRTAAQGVLGRQARRARFRGLPQARGRTLRRAERTRPTPGRATASTPSCAALLAARDDRGLRGRWPTRRWPTAASTRRAGCTAWPRARPTTARFRLSAAAAAGPCAADAWADRFAVLDEALAQSLHARGFEVTVLRLPGHGTLAVDDDRDERARLDRRGAHRRRGRGRARAAGPAVLRRRLFVGRHAGAAVRAGCAAGPRAAPARPGAAGLAGDRADAGGGAGRAHRRLHRGAAAGAGQGALAGGGAGVRPLQVQLLPGERVAADQPRHARAAALAGRGRARRAAGAAAAGGDLAIGGRFHRRLDRRGRPAVCAAAAIRSIGW